MYIKMDDLSGSEVVKLVKEHLENMIVQTPAKSMHALDIESLRKPEITFWSAWEDDELVGCGALKELDEQHGEIKSMRTTSSFRRKGVAKRVLQHIIEEARRRGYQKLSLETGSIDVFEPARSLYSSFGFQYCEPFSDYNEDQNSVFMIKKL